MCFYIVYEYLIRSTYLSILLSGLCKLDKCDCVFQPFIHSLGISNISDNEILDHGEFYSVANCLGASWPSCVASYIAMWCAFTKNLHGTYLMNRKKGNNIKLN